METINLGKIIPQKYLDYWSPEDIAEIQSYINNSLGDYENCLEKLIEIQDTLLGKYVGKPVDTPTDNRTTLAYWYQYLKDTVVEIIEPDYETTFETDYITHTLESVEYPQGTQNVTSIINIFTILFEHPLDCSCMSINLPVRNFTGTLDLSSVTNMYLLFGYMGELISVGNIVNTSKVENFQYAFFNCTKLTAIPELDCRSATNTVAIVSGCYALTSLRLKNLKVSTQIGYGTSWGHLIADEDLIFMIYHLREVVNTQTLTVGSKNLEKLANVYVRTIDITDEMRAEDDLIDEKCPFEVCKNTDEGAMLITDYVVEYKNWNLK